MHQIVSFAEKTNSKIVQKMNDIKKNSSTKLFLFDKVKLTNQKKSICRTIWNAIRNKKNSSMKCF